jgi:hypothetical protein
MRKPKNAIWATIPHQFSNRIAQLHHQRVLQIQLLSRSLYTFCAAPRCFHYNIHIIVCVCALAPTSGKSGCDRIPLSDSPRGDHFFGSTRHLITTRRCVRAASNASLVSATYYTVMPCGPPAMLLNPRVVFSSHIVVLRARIRVEIINSCCMATAEIQSPAQTGRKWRGKLTAR